MRKLTFLLLLLPVLLLSGCAMRTVDQMYSLPKRSEAYSNLQSAIDDAMPGLEYAAPDVGEHQQTVQQADLDGDGEDEYLLFAQGSSDKTLKILIFDLEGEQYRLAATIDNPGLAFEQVEYADIDDRPGLELVVGCRVSDQVLRNLTVYTFMDEVPVQLMTENYSKFLTCDLDGNRRSDVMLLSPGETDADKGRAMLFRFRAGEMQRSREVDLSGPVTDVKRIMASRLESGEAAVYVASSQDEQAIITDVFALKDERFSNISFSAEMEHSVQTLRNYYIYADDIDEAGVDELISEVSEQLAPAGRRKFRAVFSMKMLRRAWDSEQTGYTLLSELKSPERLAIRTDVVFGQGRKSMTMEFRFDVFDIKSLLPERIFNGAEREEA